MIKIDKLCKSYGDKTVLDNLCLNIKGNTIFGLLGPNGAGKTTLISILNGLKTFNSGEVQLFGKSLSKELTTIRQRCSLIPQSLAFYENLTVKENLNFFAGIQKIDPANASKNISYAVEVNRLNSMLGQKASTLSGGQKRRLNIAIGLLNNPDILFFDEPTVGIDPESRNEILETICYFKADNKCVIYTSHYMQEIEKICDEVAIINSGKIVKQGDMSTMLAVNGKQVMIELYETKREKLEACCALLPLLSIVTVTSVILHASSAQAITELLTIFEKQQIKIKQINYASSNLESLFINLTSEGK